MEASGIGSYNTTVNLAKQDFQINKEHFNQFSSQINIEIHQGVAT